MRKTRIVVQILILILFVGFIFLFNNQARGYNFPSEFFLWLNPFSALLTLVASHSIILPFAISALILAVATILFGRFFCGFACPLGTLIDAADTFFFAKIRAPHRKVPRYLQRLKYVIMIAFIVLAVFGALFTLYLDPLSFTTRLINLTVGPLLKIIKVDLNAVLGEVFPASSTLIYTMFPINIRYYYGIFATLLVAVVVFGGGFFDKRFWCQYVCPTGAFYGILGRFSLYRRTIQEHGCNVCQRCVRSCPVHAIDEKDGRKTNVSECIECGVCVEIKSGCSSFRLGRGVPALASGPDLQRRHLLAGAAGGLLLAPVFRANAISRRDDTGRLIRPPGAVPESAFLGKCIGCTACMQACPTNALQPCLFSDGINRLYTPKVVPRVGGCEEKCHLCGNVCPTGAIRPLPYEEKRFVKIGTAVLKRDRCLAWSQNRECLVCDEVCPYNAITAYVVDTTKGRFKVPVIIEDLCLGCGLCEQHCPISDEAAIVVYKFGEKRLQTGQYTSADEKEIIMERRRISDSYHLGKPGAHSHAPISNGSHDGSVPHNVPDEPPSGGLPPGFLDEAPSGGLPPGFID